jgi:hypothetical protein
VFTDPKDITYFCFHYPFSYTECINKLDHLEIKYFNNEKIYFHRELLSESIEGRRLDLLTISGQNGKLNEKEGIITGLFPKYG